MDYDDNKMEKVSSGTVHQGSFDATQLTAAEYQSCLLLCTSMYAKILVLTKLVRLFLKPSAPWLYRYAKEALVLMILLTFMLEVSPTVTALLDNVYATPVLLVCFILFFASGLLEDGATGNPAFVVADWCLKPSLIALPHAFFTLAIQLGTAAFFPLFLQSIHGLHFTPFHSHLYSVTCSSQNPLKVSSLEGALIEGMGLIALEIAGVTIFKIRKIPDLLQLVLFIICFSTIFETGAPYTGMMMNPAIAHTEVYPCVPTYQPSAMSWGTYVLVYWGGPLGAALTIRVTSNMDFSKLIKYKDTKID